jgi:hypothetical protein
MNPLLQSILQEIVIPEVIAIFRRRAQAGQPMPTEDEIKAALVEQADKYIAAGKAFLALKGVA